ncbi:MAG: RIP metalloprotease [Acidimicrobiia bacterium]
MSATWPPPVIDDRPDDEPPAEAPEERGSPVQLIVLLAAMAALGFVKPYILLAIVLLVVMIFLHELGHYVTAKRAGMKVTEFFLFFGPRIWSFKRGETEYGIKSIPAGAYVKVIGMSSLDPAVDPTEEKRTYRHASYPRRVLMASAGSLMHFFIAFVLGIALFAGYGVYKADSWKIGTVAPDSPAASAGLLPGDKILSIDGAPVDDYTKMRDVFRSKPGATVMLGVDSGGVVTQRSVTLLADCNGTVGRLGIASTAVPVDQSLPQSIVESGRVVVTGVWDSAVGLGKLFSPSGIRGYINTLSNRPDESGGSGVCASGTTEGRPSSIIGITQGVADSAKDGMESLLGIFLAINIAIGVFNLIPMLPFDGGHIAIATYERIREIGKPKGVRYHADVAKLLPVVYGVLAVFLLLFLSAGFLDITRGVN